MKKTIALVTVIIMLLSLVSCGRTSITGKISENLPDTQTEGEQQSEVVEQQPVEDEQQPVEDGQQPVVDEQQPTDEELSLGKISGLTYESEFLNLKMVMSDEWYLYSEEEIAELNNITVSAYDDDYQKQLENADYFYDLFAQNMINGGTVNIMFEKVNTIASVVLDEEKYIDLSIDSFSNIDPNSGMSVVSYEKDMDSVLAGRTVPSFSVVMDYGVIPVYERCFVFKKGAYFSTLTIACADEASLDTIISCFTSID